MLKLKRVYDPAARTDGRRFLVERLWPRGVSKEQAAIELWLRDVAPSTELRKWYGHDPQRWPEFRRRYRKELDKKVELTALLRHVAAARTVTFVYAASDKQRNSAIVLKEFLEARA